MPGAFGASGRRVTRALVVGGYGVFGSLIARELARRSVPVTIAGRDGVRAKAAAAALGSEHEHAGVALDLADRAALAPLLAAKPVVVNAAGPFHAFGTALLEACLDAGCHHVDIADDRAYARVVRALDPRLRESGVAAVWGCSSFPAVSMALVRAARGDRPAPSRARITLFIGNDNAKGYGAIASASAQAGRIIAAPQGTLVGFRGKERVPLPAPFGERPAFDYDSAEYDLLAAAGVAEVRVKVGFENPIANAGFAVLSRLPLRPGRRTASLLAMLGRFAPRWGSSGGAVMAELWWPDGSSARASLSGAKDGQLIAALPAVLVAQVLCAGRAASGAMTAPELLGAETLLGGLQRAGFTLG